MDLDAFLGNATLANARVDHAADRAVLMFEGNRKVVPNGRWDTWLRHGRCADPPDGRPRQRDREVNEVTTFPDQSSAADLRILDPMIARNFPGVHTNDDVSRGLGIPKEFLHPLSRGSKTAIEPHHE